MNKCILRLTAGLSVLGLFHPTLSAQPQAGYNTLKAVDKSAQRPATARRPDYGIRRIHADSALLSTYRSQPLSVLLSQQYPVFIRTYGTNGLATLSLRGASAAQTALRWNGVPLQNGTTGLVDLALVPVSVIDDATLEYGSNGGLNGSGAIGGTLYISNNRPVFSKARHITASIAGGSFARLTGTVKLQQSGARWSGSMAASGQRADNNFTYTGTDGQRRSMTHAKAASGSVLASLAHRLSKHTTISGTVWADKSMREIPPALFEQYSVRVQRDAAVRSLLEVAHSRERIQASLQLSCFDEWFRYDDSLSYLATRLHSRQWYAAPAIGLRVAGRTQLNISLPQQLNQLVGEPSKRILKSALVASLDRRFGHGHSLSANARGESINGKLYGAGGINAGFYISNAVELRGSAGYAYRAPTLNELYYTPGGNPDLLAEKGTNAEGGYTWAAKQRNGVIFSHSGTAFYRNMNNWILWLGGAIWTPHNIARVVSSGLETENKVSWKRARIRYTFMLQASYIRSMTMESRLPNDASIGRQIPYAPRVLANGNIGFTTRRWRLNYNQTYMGVRYYNTDETGELPAFTLGNIQAGWQQRLAGWTVDIGLQLQNIWNQSYAEVSGRPAAGTSFLVSLAFLQNK